MVIGNGLLAHSFHEYTKRDDIVVFASGVSNSKETHCDAFNREINLLIQTLESLGEKTIIYFSTCSIEDPSLQKSAYVNHKKEMEKLIASRASKRYIFRLPQVVGPTNSPTLIHFFFEAIQHEKMIHIHTKATRNIIWYQDIVTIVNEIIASEALLNSITNIASPFHLPIEQIIGLIENELQIKAKKNWDAIGASYAIDTSEINEIANDLHIFHPEYPREVIRKYATFFKKTLC